MKKFTALLLSLILATTLMTSCSQSNDVAEGTVSDVSSSEPTLDATPDAEQTELTSEVPLDTFMVGSGEMLGDFVYGFGTNTYDVAVQTLVGGYMGTYVITPTGEIVQNNTVVSQMTTDTDEDGNKSYIFTLHDDLLWNNGEPMTAEDYVASVLWNTSPQWAEAGAAANAYSSLIGYSEYSAGETDVFTGVKLIDELQFSVTVSAEELPYFWENYNAIVDPLPFKSYLPTATISSGDDGSSFVFSEGDLLSECTRVASSERYAPSVSCGPYSFVSFENQTVTLQRNEHFKGDYNGNKPYFEYVIQKAIPLETSVEWVTSGQIDLVAGVVEGEKIEAAKASDAVTMQSYLRSGYGYLAMMCDYGVTADNNVRWALASLIDRSSVVDYVLGGYGSTVDSEYGIGQWMYQETAAELQEALKPISFNIDVANDYLDETQWIYEEDGTTPFERSKANADGTYMRHNEQGERLVVNHLGSLDNVLTDIIEIEYIANAPLAGMEFNVEKVEYSSMIDTYYASFETPEEERIYNTFNLATNFSFIFDRYTIWHSDFIGAQQNRLQLSDATLDELIIEMRQSDPDDIDGYLETWLNYQVRWNELMPTVPLYSNEYYDIAHAYVDNLNTTIYATYDEIICEISKSEK